jgi:hypothetical protein
MEGREMQAEAAQKSGLQVEAEGGKRVAVR